MKKSFLWIFVFVWLMGCGENVDPVDDNEPVLRDLTPQEESLVLSSNEFAFDLFHELNDPVQMGNLFFSPLSVQYALAMTLNGSDRETYEAIREVLKNETLNEQEINESYQSLTQFLFGIDKTVLLKIANSIWYRKDLTVKEAFKQAVQIYYDAGISGLDFSDPGAKDEINGWVNNKTEGLIGDLIDQIPAGVVMYLINAIYYKADWKYQFDESMTQDGPFFLDDGSQIQTELMTVEEAEVGFYRNDNLRLVDIPYGNGQFSMTILLPSTNHTLEELYGSFNEEAFNNWVSQLQTLKSTLTMPKFRIEYKTLLNDALSSMGMDIAFTGQADFSRLFEEPMDLYISRVIHQAVIEVNEEGSEAAAATAVEIMETSLPPEPQIIQINQPFIFMIREKFSGTILFAGKLMDPS